MPSRDPLRALRKLIPLVVASLTLLTGPAKAEVLPGEAKAYACTACHGEAGLRSAPGMPAIGGRDTAALLAALDDFRAGRRFQPYMQLLLSGMDREDLTDVADYFAIMGAGEAPQPSY